MDDCETPVSAFLKLRDGGPCFLLESAEQGRLGRYSFLGFSPRAVLRWDAGMLSEWGGERFDGEPVRRLEAADPYAAMSQYLSRYRLAPVDGLPPFAGGAVGFFGYDLVRTVEPLGAPNPDPIGLPDMALMVSDVLVVFDHMRHELTLMAYAVPDERTDLDAAHANAVAAIADVRERLRGPVPRPAVTPAREPAKFESNMTREQFEANVRRCDRVHPRRRRIPGRPLTALLGPVSGRALLDLPRPADDQPLAVHVLPGLRRLPARRGLARAAGEGDGAPGRDPADRRHLPAGCKRGGGSPPGRGAPARPEGAR